MNAVLPLDDDTFEYMGEYNNEDLIDPMDQFGEKCE